MTFTRSLLSSYLDKGLFNTWQMKTTSYGRLTTRPVLREVQLAKLGMILLMAAVTINNRLRSIFAQPVPASKPQRICGNV